jgi:hypothetical protein
MMLGLNTNLVIISPEDAIHVLIVEDVVIQEFR